MAPSCATPRNAAFKLPTLCALTTRPLGCLAAKLFCGYPRYSRCFTRLGIRQSKGFHCTTTHTKIKRRRALSIRPIERSWRAVAALETVCQIGVGIFAEDCDDHLLSVGDSHSAPSSHGRVTVAICGGLCCATV